MARWCRVNDRPRRTKLPLPAPAWLGELQQRDYVQPLLEAYQHQTASYWKSGAQITPPSAM